MKDEKEINVLVAKAIYPGVTDTCAELVFHDGQWKKPKNYFGDYNTRPEMLASLTEEEFKNLCAELVAGASSPEDEWRALMFLEQPDFARRFAKVKGIL